MPAHALLVRFDLDKRRARNGHRLDARNQRNGDKVNLDRLAGRIEALQLLYKDLSTDGLGQAVDLGHYVSEIASAAMHTYAVDGIRLDLTVDHAPASINVAMPIGEGGTITVRCLHENRIVIGDDGIGLPDGVSWPVAGKLGALIVQSLRENVKANFSVESNPGKGVRVTIAFVHHPELKKAN